MKKYSKASGPGSRTPAAGKRNQHPGASRPYGSRQQSSFEGEPARRKPGTGSGSHTYKSRKASSSEGDTPGRGPRNTSEPQESQRPFGPSGPKRSRFPSKDNTSGSRETSGPGKSKRPFGTYERDPKAAPRTGYSAAYRPRDPQHKQLPAEDASGTPREAGPGRPFSGPKSGRGPSRRPQAGHARSSKHEAGPFRSKGGSFQEFPLNKYIAHCGICSRRKAVEFIKDGLVKVNGSVVTEPGTKVQPSDQVQLNGKPLKVQQELAYLLVNKPKGYITTTKDPRARKTVMELIEDACPERVYPVGRLDRNTSGLLLLTNDGDLAQKLSHPSNNIRKVYQAGLDKPLTKADFDKIVQGIELEDGPIHADVLAYSDAEDRRQVGIEIHSGRNHIVRRIFAALGYEVLTLDRVLYAGLTKKNLPRGKWRFLSEREVIFLKHF